MLFHCKYSSLFIKLFPFSLWPIASFQFFVVFLSSLVFPLRQSILWILSYRLLYTQRSKPIFLFHHLSQCGYTVFCTATSSESTSRIIKFQLDFFLPLIWFHIYSLQYPARLFLYSRYSSVSFLIYVFMLELLTVLIPSLIRPSSKWTRWHLI